MNDISSCIYPEIKIIATFYPASYLLFSPIVNNIDSDDIITSISRLKSSTKRRLKSSLSEWLHSFVFTTGTPHSLLGKDTDKESVL